MAQNSILTWLGVGLGSFVGIIELSSSNLKMQAVIFELLAIGTAVSLERIVTHMGDVLTWRDTIPEFTSPSRKAPISIAMELSLRYLKNHRGVLTILIIIYLIAVQFVWFIP